MAMTGNGMAAQVKANIEALQGFPGSNFLRDDVLQAFCQGIVEHIQQNADVKAGLLSTGTVTSGAGEGGTVETTGELFEAGIE